MITTEAVKQLRDETGISVMQCKKALEEAGGDKAKAIVLLRKKGAAAAAKKADRTLHAGTIGVYVHGNGTAAALVILSSETDFVANNDEFKTLARDIAMQVVATAPEYVSYDAIPEQTKKEAREVLEKELKGTPPAMREKIMEGKLLAHFKERTLLDQPFIKNQDMTVRSLIEYAVQKFGEKIEVGKFTRFSLS